MRAAVVGAGLAGLTAARALANQGLDPVVFDKGRGPGGRMSVRRIDTAFGEAAFDHGAQYFTARSARFRAEVDAWRVCGVVAPWPAAGADASVGAPAMNAPLQRLAASLDTRFATEILSLARRGEAWVLETEGGEEVFDLLILAVPAEQAARLLAPVHAEFGARARAAPSQPCWSVMAAFAERLTPDWDCRRWDASLGWAARNSAKPGRVGPEAWVLHAGPGWTVRHLEAPAIEVADRLFLEFQALVGPCPPPIVLQAHRWRYARAGGHVFNNPEGGALYDRRLRLGVCGDWLVGPRVEAAFVSATGLIDAVAA